MVQSSASEIDKPLVIVGLMGCGKSAIGVRLAKKLGYDFVDSDKEIEQQEGCKVTKIFEAQGEDYFRAREYEVIKRLLDRKSCVIATGGGAFVNENIRSLILHHAVSVWIRASLEVLYGRVSKKNTRPLLEKGDKKSILETLIKQRYPIYQLADITVDTSDAPHDKMVRAIMDKLDMLSDKD